MYLRKVVTINEGIVDLIEHCDIEIKKEQYLNYTNWTFSSTNEEVLNNYTNDFVKNNSRYIISYNDMPLEKLVVNELMKRELTISFCESCTGGMLASTLVNVSGASNIFEQSFVTYSEDAKMKVVNVNRQTLKKYGVYSSEVAEEMALGLYNKTRSNICVSVTGRAGGDEYSEGDGTCDFAIVINTNNADYVQLEHYSVQGTRNEVRKMQTIYIFWRILLVLKSLNKNKNI